MPLKPGSPETAAQAREGRIRSNRRRAEEVAERIASGESWVDVAASYGVTDVKGFRRRVKAHVGEIQRRSDALEVLSEVQVAVDGLYSRLAEIRRRYE